MSGQPKLSSRLSSLNMFGKFTSRPPPPVEKDPWYQTGGSKSAVSLAPSQALSMHAPSIASMSVETLQLPQTPLCISAAHSQCDLSRTMSPASTRSRTTTMTTVTAQSHASEHGSFRRGISKLSSSLGKKSRLFLRANSSRTTLSVDSTRVSQDGIASDSDGDGLISWPQNVKHDLHVDEGLANLPPEWMDQLRQEGFKDTDVLSIHSRRNRTTYLKNHPDVSVDVLRARANNSPYTPTSTSTSPNSLSPLPKSALPARSTSLRRPTTSSSTSVTTSARSGGSSRSPDSTSPPSSYGFSSSGAPSDSSVSSRAPSPYADGDSDECPDPGTATATHFAVSATRLSVRASRVLPRLDSPSEDPPAHTPPSRAATLTFVVTNPTPPSPPPAYDHLESSSAQTQTFPREEKTDPSRDDRRTGGFDAQQPERRSEDTLTPEVLLISENNDAARSERALHSEASHCNGSETSPPPFRLHLQKPSRDESSSTSPSDSPVNKTTSLPPRLSLHQDDLSSWSAELFSVISTPDPVHKTFAEASSPSVPVSRPRPTVDPVPAVSAKTTSPKTRKAPVPPLVLTRANDIPRVTIETDDDDSIETGSDIVEHAVGTSTTPLFNEVLSLVKPNASSSPNVSPPLTSTYPYLPDPPPLSSPNRSPIASNSQPEPSLSPSHSPNVTYEFLNEHYDPHRDSTVSSSAGSRESQATISASSRWSRATTVRDVRDATIGVAHVRKPSVANAMTVPAPVAGRHSPQPSTSTIQSEGSGNGSGSNGSRPLSSASSDGMNIPTAADFPLPPPSPGAFSISSVQPSPMSGKFSVISDDVCLPYTVGDSGVSVNRVSSPTASVRSSQLSSRSGSSSSSSQVNPLSVTSGSDEHHDGSAVHVELRYAEGNILSPTGSTVSEVDAMKWSAERKKLSPPARMDIAPRIFTTAADNDDEQDAVSCFGRGSDVPDGASTVVEWLDDTPSPQFDPNDKPIRDSGTLYNLIGEPSPHVLLHSNALDKDRQGSPQMERPSLQINGIVASGSPDKPLPRLSPGSAGGSLTASASTSPSSGTPSPSPSPSPMDRYRGWVSEVVAPLEEFIDHMVDPRELYTDLQEIAEGESGSVFSATVAPPPSPKTRSKMSVRDVKARRSGKAAVKQVPLLPGGSPKLEDLRKELMLVSRVSHMNILSMDALYVDLVEDSLWIEMELMERSLADVLALAEEGLVLEEVIIARFTGDILGALTHLETLGIVHRDVRSDNLLVNSQGVLKLADFSNALLVDATYPTYTEPAGVIYWQAPEMRTGSYDARKVDVWSAGATAWEMAEAEPPFMNTDISDPRQLPQRWPTLSRFDTYSRSFHDFLHLCSNPPSSRPTANDLLTTPFIRSSCARSLIVDLMAQCKTIEERRLRRTSSDSQGTILS
ncbi:hypothetical protein ACEPAH_2439 [Sanghuangporus vaninii]